MTGNILGKIQAEEIFYRPGSLKGTNIRLAALLITVVLHVLLFWWGMKGVEAGRPSPPKISAIRVFLQPLALPELLPPLRPPRAAVEQARPQVAPTPVVLAGVSSPPPAALPTMPAPIPPSPAPTAPEAVVNPATVPSPSGAVSLAPLPVVANVPVSPGTAVVINALPNHSSGAGGSANPAAGAKISAGVGQNEGVVPSGPVAPVAAGGTAGAGKALYLRALFAHIEAHKYYPPSARRRQLQGQVRVAFTIEPGGGVSDLKVSEGHPQLEAAALQTVQSAMPLPLPAEGVTLPFTLSYHMDFRLR